MMSNMVIEVNGETKAVESHVFDLLSDNFSLGQMRTMVAFGGYITHGYGDFSDKRIPFARELALIAGRRGVIPKLLADIALMDPPLLDTVNQILEAMEEEPVVIDEKEIDGVTAVSTEGRMRGKLSEIRELALRVQNLAYEVEALWEHVDDVNG